MALGGEWAAGGGDRRARRPRSLSVDEYATGILAGDRVVLARAITLIESVRPDHQAMARELVQRVLPHAGKSIRLGITGAPGVGKSAFIDAFGVLLTGHLHRVAVLSIDPSSAKSGGSLLGDKTRMARLSVDPAAFIRPSPSGLVLGGIARQTRETMMLCEAAGFDIVLIETVGVGQSEVTVADMTDFLLVLLTSGGGDELQGIKRGLLELADLLAITKADGDNVIAARQAAAKYAYAMHILAGPDRDDAPVVTCSSLQGTGLGEIWTLISDRISERERTGALAKRRSDQNTTWMWSLVDQQLREMLHEKAALNRIARNAAAQVRAGTLSPVVAAERIRDALFAGTAPPLHEPADVAQMEDVADAANAA
ncbi:MAG TPA: methylmalonyl Co-A mutase-associated GTPase MeaB [Acidisphaera sp.]|nr:methylmalonyl Co-A mutase-associated GTPase MeaB [Acidisphaera sp.]